MDGELHISRSIPLSVITGILLLLTSITGSWIVLGRYKDTVTVQGQVTPTVLPSRIYAAKPGVVESLYVHDGDIVKAGDPIARIKIEQPLTSGESPNRARAVLVEKQARNALDQVALAKRRAAEKVLRINDLIRDLNNEIERVKEQLGAETAALTSMRSYLDRAAPLARDNLISKSAYDTKEETYFETEAQRHALEGQLSSLEERLHSAQHDLAEIKSEERGNVDTYTAAYDALQQHKFDYLSEEEYLVSAPIAGQITGIQASIGKYLDSRLQLASVVPLGSRMDVLLLATSKAVGLTKVGDQVRIMYDGFPYQHYGSFRGQVTAVSRNIISDGEVDSAQKPSDPVYPVRVRVSDQSIFANGERHPLQPGMTLTADIVLSSRSFAEWLLQPLTAVKNR
jgi:membrane fusion protein